MASKTCAASRAAPTCSAATGASRAAAGAAGVAMAPATRAGGRGRHEASGRHQPTRKVNHVEFRPKRSRNVSPLTVTVPSSPVSVSLSTRPPQSPFPSRLSTAILVRLPRLDHWSSIAVSSSVRVQSW